MYSSLSSGALRIIQQRNFLRISQRATKKQGESSSEILKIRIPKVSWHTQAADTQVHTISRDGKNENDHF